jgi:mannose-1-phosphate guanylyltransferase
VEIACLVHCADILLLMPSAPSRYALILAGGSGQRFWPISRDALPKQLLKLFGDKTLLELTVERLEGLVPKERILILTNSQQEAAVRALLPDLPDENILAEPEKRDTAPAIALGISWVAARDPLATMLVLPADHLIQDRAAFQSVLRGAAETAEASSGLVTVGIKPTWPCPSYGYVERGARASFPGVKEEVAIYDVVRFREKPNPELAEQFLSQGNFSWNAGMFIWTIPAIISELAHHTPVLANFVAELRKSSDFAATVKTQFGRLPKLSIDYALMERASRVLNIEATFDWDDVGNWTSVGRYLQADPGGNQHNCALTQFDAEGNIVFSETGQHVALIGVQDLIVVAAKDALLVTTKSHAEHIKKLVDSLPKELH